MLRPIFTLNLAFSVLESDPKEEFLVSGRPRVRVKLKNIYFSGKLSLWPNLVLVLCHPCHAWCHRGSHIFWNFNATPWNFSKSHGQRGRCLKSASASFQPWQTSVGFQGVLLYCNDLHVCQEFIIPLLVTLWLVDKSNKIAQIVWHHFPAQLSMLLRVACSILLYVVHFRLGSFCWLVGDFQQPIRISQIIGIQKQDSTQ